MLGSNQRPPPCRDGALPAELIALGIRKCIDPRSTRPSVGRLDREMRRRVAASIAVLGIAATAAVSQAAAGDAPPTARAASTMHPAVSPRTGSTRAHFVVSFHTGVSTERSGTLVRSYRVSASAGKRSGCVWSGAATAPAAAQGALVRVTLVPGGHSAWCAETYQGQVVLSQTVRCGPPSAQVACPAIEVRPEVVGRFSFRVTRG